MNKRLLIITIFLGMISCNLERKSDEKHFTIDGKAQGTTYHISIVSDISNINIDTLKFSIDSLLLKIDLSMSTYRDNSIISKINMNEPDIELDKYFETVFNRSQEIAEQTNGFFDVTVGELVKAWGFSFKSETFPDSTKIDSLLKFTGYKNVSIYGKRVNKSIPEIKLDFNAIAQGYSVDVLCEFLISKGFNSFIVELGGEVRALGKKNNIEYWKIGIDKPIESNAENRVIKAIVELENKSLATSGNYRKFRIVDGKKFSHTINPQNGYPVNHQLMSATVIANDCMTADAYATAFMVMGKENTIEFLAKNKNLNLEVYLISVGSNGEWETYITDDLRTVLKEVE